MEALRGRLRSTAPTKGSDALFQREASDAAAADVAHLKWLQLESERQQTRADVLQDSLKSMRQQGVQLSSRVQQLEAALECREQQLLNQSLQNEQDKCQLQAKIEVQGADLLKVQQELERVQRLYQQECRSTATHKASAAAAWDRFEGLVRQLIVVVVKAAAALEVLNRGRFGTGSACSAAGLARAVEVLQSLIALRHIIMADMRQERNEAALTQESSVAAAEPQQQQQQERAAGTAANAAAAPAAAPAPAEESDATAAAAAAAAAVAAAVTSSAGGAAAGLPPTDALQAVIQSVVKAVLEAKKQHEGQNPNPAPSRTAGSKNSLRQPALAALHRLPTAAAAAAATERLLTTSPGSSSSSSTAARVRAQCQGSYAKAAAARAAAPAVAFGRSHWKEAGRVGRAPGQQQQQQGAAGTSSVHRAGRAANPVSPTVPLLQCRSSPNMAGSPRCVAQGRRLLLGQQKQVVEQDVLWHIALAWEQQQQQQQAVAADLLTHRSCPPCPTEQQEQQQQQQLEDFKQHYCNPLWTEWSSPSF